MRSGPSPHADATYIFNRIQGIYHTPVTTSPPPPPSPQPIMGNSVRGLSVLISLQVITHISNTTQGFPLFFYKGLTEQQERNKRDIFKHRCETLIIFMKWQT